MRSHLGINSLMLLRYQVFILSFSTVSVDPPARNWSLPRIASSFWILSSWQVLRTDPKSYDSCAVCATAVYDGQQGTAMGSCACLGTVPWWDPLMCFDLEDIVLLEHYRGWRRWSGYFAEGPQACLIPFICFFWPGDWFRPPSAWLIMDETAAEMRIF